jgi:DNA-binding HxlR family transcriptional regulator
METERTSAAFCPRFHKAIEQIGSRWTGVIIAAITNDVHRFGEMKAVIPGLSDRMLADRLKELQADGLVERVVYPETPVRVEYHLTEKGCALADVMEAVSAWAEDWVPLDDELAGQAVEETAVAGRR